MLLKIGQLCELWILQDQAIIILSTCYCLSITRCPVIRSKKAVIPVSRYAKDAESGM